MSALEQANRPFQRYRLIEKLATGGMAEIYLACIQGIEGFEKRVVIKRILPHFGEHPEFVSMFLDEARLVARLNHPNIAQVYDIGYDGRAYYFSMEYVDGRDVAEIRDAAAERGETLPLDQAIAIVMGVAAGLHAAHEKRGTDGKPLGVVHRDVSAHNVLVTWDGAVKLIDFGIAKAVRRQTQTLTGVVKGKRATMSPEQCTAGPVDRRSDIFSLGIMLWELTVGEMLFDADSEYEIMQRIVGGDVPRPTARRPGYPPQLEAIVMKALATDPADRYQTAREMLVELDLFAREQRLATAPHCLADTLRGLFPAAEPDRENGASPPLFLSSDSAQLSRAAAIAAAASASSAELEAIDPATTLTFGSVGPVLPEPVALAGESGPMEPVALGSYPQPAMVPFPSAEPERTAPWLIIAAFALTIAAGVIVSLLLL